MVPHLRVSAIGGAPQEPRLWIGACRSRPAGGWVWPYRYRAASLSLCPWTCWAAPEESTTLPILGALYLEKKGQSSYPERHAGLRRAEAIPAVAGSGVSVGAGERSGVEDGVGLTVGGGGGMAVGEDVGVCVGGGAGVIVGGGVGVFVGGGGGGGGVADGVGVGVQGGSSGAMYRSARAGRWLRGSTGVPER